MSVRFPVQYPQALLRVDRLWTVDVLCSLVMCLGMSDKTIDHLRSTVNLQQALSEVPSSKWKLVNLFPTSSVVELPMRLVYSGISKQPQLLDLMNRLPGNDEYKQIKCKQEL